MAESIEVLNPVADLPAALRSISAAPRPTTLDGKRVGLYWNYKPGGKDALERVGEAIKARFKDVTVKTYSAPRPVPKGILESIVSECDVVVGSTAD